MKKVFPLILVIAGTSNSLFSQQDCHVPDTVYLYFENKEGLTPNYKGHMKTRDSESGKEFQYGFSYPEVFQAKTQGEELDIHKFMKYRFTKIEDLFRMNSEYIKCYISNIKYGDPMIIHMNDDVFKNIYLIEKKESKYFKYKVSWLNIEYG